MINKYAILDLKSKDFMKNKKGEINFYDTKQEAITICSIYEFENVWVVKMIHNYKE
jgi:hypothetical protein